MAESARENFGAEEPELIDLSFLTAEEKEKIESVLKADEVLRTKDRIRLGTLRQEFEQARSHQVQFKNLRQCSCCECPLGRIFNSGALCPSCGNRVCKVCRVKSHDSLWKFICTVCDKRWFVEIQAREYRSISPPIGSVPPLSPMTLLVEAPKSKLYGTELVKKSLQLSSHDGPNRRPTVTSVSSSIVVKYIDRGSSGQSPSPTSTFKFAHVRSQAKELSLDEIISKSSSEEEDEFEEESGEDLEKKVPGKSLLMTHSSSLESLASNASVYSAEGGKGNYEITGRVKVGVWHKDEMLFVRVVKAEGLAGVKGEGISDPYVKTYLLPDKSKHTKRKTGIQRKTVNPDYNEILKNKLLSVDIPSHTLWLSVWDWDRFGRNQFLGEVRFPLSTLDLSDSTDRWYTLHDKQVQEDNIYKGRLKVALKFSPQSESSKGLGSLFISVQEAEDLPKMDPFGLTDATVKLYLLPDRSSSTKKKTTVVKNSLNPVWNEEFEYKLVNLKELKTTRVLEVTVWDYDRRGSNDFIGGLRLGPAHVSGKHKDWMDTSEEEASHWEEVLAHPSEWIEHWHTLRSAMVPPSKQTSEISSYLTPVPSSRTVPRPPSPEDKSAISSGNISSPRSSTSPQSFLPTVAPSELSHPSTSSHSPVSSKESTPIPEIVISSNKEASNLKRNLGESSGSLTSLYSVAGGVKGDYSITGEVLIKFQHEKDEFLVYINRAQGLAAADSNGFSDPYIKTYLLPDKSKHSKRKTEIKRKTLDPVYKETLKYKVKKSEFSKCTLWLSVWDWDRFGRNKFLGEIRFPLASINLEDSNEHWYQLQDKDNSGPVQVSHVDPSHCGELRVGLKFSPTETKDGNTKGTLHVAIKNAMSLSNLDEKGLTDGFVKLYLLPDKSSKGKRKTGVIKDSLNPTWEQNFTYEKVTLEDLSTKRVLEITVWDHDKTSNDFVGGLRIGPVPNQVKQHKEWIDSNKDEASHWEQMLAHPGEWVERWHTLRSSMDPRDVDLSSISSLLKEGNIVLDEDEGNAPPSTDLTEEDDQSKENMVDDFKKVSVNDTSKSSVPGPNEEYKVASVRKRPEISLLGQMQLSKSSEDDSSKEDVTLKQSLPASQVATGFLKKKPSPPAHSITSDDKVEVKPEHAQKTDDVIFHKPDTTISSDQSSNSPFPKVSKVSSLLARNSTAPSSSPLLKQLKHFGSSSTLGSTASFGSMTSIYSSALGPGGKRDYDITGEVLFSVIHVDNQLIINVNRARNLAATNKQGFSNAYVKTYLLPDKSKNSKLKTTVRKKTLNPVYNETLKYNILKSEIDSRTLWLSVWDWDRFGRNQFLGEVKLLPLSSLDLSDSTEYWYTLQDKTESGHSDIDEFVRGEIKLGLMFKPSAGNPHDKGTLNILIKQAKDLPPMNSNGLTDSTVKCFLLPSRSSSSKRKTGIIKNNLNPVWEEMFVYEHVSLEELLKNRVLEITLWDCDKHGNDFIGGLRLGSVPGRSSRHKDWMDSIGLEVSHWEGMLSQPGEWIEEWHTLRPSMDPREVDLSMAPPPFKVPFTSHEHIKHAGKHPKVKEVHQPLSQKQPKQPDYHQQEATKKEFSEDNVSMESPTSPVPAIQLDTPSAYKIHPTPVAESRSGLESPEVSGDESKYRLQGVAKRSGLLGLSMSDSVTSFGSMTSIYSAAGGKGDYDITGEVSFGISYKDGHLLVHIDRARGLAAADSNGLSDPYIKTYLLPDKSKHSKKKTDVKRRTLNPVYDCTLKYKISRSDIASRTLWLSVWDWDRFGRNQFLGEVRLSLSSHNLIDTADHWYSLQDKNSSEDERDTYKGELNISLMFEPMSSKKGKIKGTLHVSVKQAKDLSNPNSKAATDSFVKCYLLPDKGSSGKRKTSVIKNNSNPVWEELFAYEKLNLDELATERVLEVAVWDLNKGSSNEFIGGLRLGPAPRAGIKHKEWMDSIGEEVNHWESVMGHPGEWWEKWHTLRTTMDYRSVSLE